MLEEIPPPPADPQAYVILFLWPIIVAILFKRLPLREAAAWSVVGGYLLLPAAWVVNVDLPLVPSLDKALLPSLAVVIFGTLALRRMKTQSMRRTIGSDAPGPKPNILPGWLPRSFIGLSLIALLIVGSVMTVLTNRDPLFYGELMLPGQRPTDALSIIMASVIALLPMLIGRKFLADHAGHNTLLKILCISAVIYAIPALYEVRMSPQLNNMIYGFFPHSFAQHIRAGGFRPLVFLDHGLQLGIFFACAVVGMATLVRLSKTGGERLGYIAALVFMLGILYMSKTLGALLITVVLLPIALLFPVRLQLIAAATIAAITITYPILRGAGLVPVQELTNVAMMIDAERAGSLMFRFDNEDMLLDRANERPLFGWSGWGRWRVWDEYGNDLTVSDGEWIIAISQYGWAGYIAKFGLFCLPLILFTIRQRRYDVSLATSGLCLVIAANLIDLLPNASPSPVFWLIVGALLGRLEYPRSSSVLNTDETEDTAPVALRTGRPMTGDIATPGLPTLGGSDQPALSEIRGHTTRYSRFPHRPTRQRS